MLFGFYKHLTKLKMKDTKKVFNQVDILFIVLFYISFLNSALGGIFYISLLFYWRYGVEGCVKSLLLVTARGIMSSAVAAIPVFSMFRLVIILGASLLILFNSRENREDALKFAKVEMALILFSIIVVLSSVWSSSYPVTSIFKVVSFSVPFLAVMKGISSTKYDCRWNDYFVLFFSSLFAISAILIPFARFRITNGNFQGVFNQVNMFGIVAAIFITAVLECKVFNDKNMIRVTIIVVTLIMLFLSASRTGMFTAITVILVNFLFGKKVSSKKMMFIGILILYISVLYIFFQADLLVSMQQNIIDFVYKGDTSNILASRQSQLELYQKKFEVSKLFGGGFMVPYEQGFVDYSLNFNLNVEPGNLIWSLLGDIGIIGTISFVFFTITIALQGKLSRLYILVGALMINMGETVFFSSNNMSILIYFLISIYMFGENEQEYYIEECDTR